MTQLIKKLSEPKRILFAGLLYTFLITIIFLMPTQDLPKSNFEWADKIVHISIHVLLASLWFLYVYTKKGKVVAKQIVLVVALCIGYGIIIEVLQQVLTATRTADVFDVFANTIGTFLGLGVFWTVKNIFKI